MPIKDVFLPLFGEPRVSTLAAIEKCVACRHSRLKRIGRVSADQIGLTLAEPPRFSDLALIPMKPHDAGQFCSVGGSDWSRSDKCRQARFECEWLSSRAHLDASFPGGRRLFRGAGV